MVVRAIRSMVFAAGLLFAPVALARAQATPDVLIAAAKNDMMTDPRAALADAENARRLLDGRGGDAAELARATSDWLRAEALSRLDENARAAPIAGAALDTVARRWPNAKLHADLWMTSGGIAKEQNRMGDALAAFQRAHNLFRDLGETRSQTIALIMLATLYQDGSDHRSALRYFRQAIDALHGADRNLLLSIRNNLGNSFESLKRYDEAAREYGEALKVARTMESPSLRALVMTNIAHIEVAQGKLDAADRMLAEAFAVARAGAASDRSIRVVSARLALVRGNPRRAVALVDSIFAGTDIATTAPALAEAHRVAADAYRQVGRLDDAYAHLTALKRIDDTAARLATDTGNALMSARFDSTNKELQIAKLRADDAQRSAELARTRSLLLVGALFVVIAGAGLLGFGLVQIRRSRNQVRAANVDLEASNVALARALKAKSDFLATTSHEFRTPLNGILGMTQVLLADAEMPERARDRLAILQDAGKAMHSLVEDVLDIAMLDDGKVRLANAPLDLRGVLGALAAHWQVEAEAKQLAFACDLTSSPGMIEGDAPRVAQIVGHLLSNAVKFTPSGTVTLAACVRGDRVEISVVDTGVGIPEDQHALVFEKFHQVDTGTTRRFGGVGVGLTVARNLAAAMDGAILLDSTPGKGASFRFHLPLREAVAPSRAPANSICLADAGLLLVEPNRLALSVTLHGLRPIAASVDAVSDLDAAHARIARGGLHHLIVQADAAARTPDPQEALRALVGVASRAGAATTIIFAPADFAEADLQATGAARLLAKPIALPALVAALTGDQAAPEQAVRAA